MIDLLTTAQAAARLGISVGRISQFIHAGRLPAVKVGRDWLIAPADLAAVEHRTNGYPKGRPRK